MSHELVRCDGAYTTMATLLKVLRHPLRAGNSTLIRRTFDNKNGPSTITNATNSHDKSGGNSRSGLYTSLYSSTASAETRESLAHFRWVGNCYGDSYANDGFVPGEARVKMQLPTVDWILLLRKLCSFLEGAMLIHAARLVASMYSLRPG